MERSEVTGGRLLKMILEPCLLLSLPLLPDGCVENSFSYHLTLMLSSTLQNAKRHQEGYVTMD